MVEKKSPKSTIGKRENCKVSLCASKSRTPHQIRHSLDERQHAGATRVE